ncbi:hypothetical protein AB205_0207440 [Aquarana catesbeiana]|uniref:Uncharacterized protein n=1 Tax=Aquarana catesbeiana TaxID=8400 RepID=A0A2G9S4M7_AQUCT|nr:hypothetical protein AB205_0207440 [Aquarana catesbeiana]
MSLIRLELFHIYEHCLLTAIEFCDHHNEPSSEREEFCKKLLQVLDEGTMFFDGLFQKLQTTYQFKLEDYMDGMAICGKPLRKTVKFALISVQRSMICQEQWMTSSCLVFRHARLYALFRHSLEYPRVSSLSISESASRLKTSSLVQLRLTRRY